MDVKVNILNVKDGDAIIVELAKSGQSLFMVIDGGEPAYYVKKMKPVLEAVLKAHGKKAPDIVVCTHCDSDHIGGLIPLLTDYGADVGEVWVHKIPAALKEYIVQAQLLPGNAGLRNIHSQDNHPLSLLLESYPADRQVLAEQKIGLLLESLPQLQQLMDVIPPQKLVEAFTNARPLAAWPEVSILGPTRAYFNTLFPPNKSFESFIEEEVPTGLFLTEQESFLRKQAKLAGIKPCDRLKTQQEAELSNTNKASIIIAIDAQEGRYLFTGDAGIDSLKNISDWQNALKDLYFLKVPHHASNNNLSKELSDVMQPVYAYSSGSEYQDDEVLGCLKSKARNKQTKTTKTDGDLIFDSAAPGK